jgi:hypothetical protein
METSLNALETYDHRENDQSHDNGDRLLHFLSNVKGEPRRDLARWVQASMTQSAVSFRL